MHSPLPFIGSVFHKPTDYDVSAPSHEPASNSAPFDDRRHTRWALSVKRVVAALIWKDGKILVCQRTRHQVMPLKWEFPGGKIEDGEQPRDALRRELDEELGIQAVIGDEVARLLHQYPSGNSVELRFYDVHKYSGDIENRIFREVTWAEPVRLPDYDFLEADLELVKDLAAGKFVAPQRHRDTEKT